MTVVCFDLHVPQHCNIYFQRQYHVYLFNLNTGGDLPHRSTIFLEYLMPLTSNLDLSLNLDLTRWVNCSTAVPLLDRGTTM